MKTLNEISCSEDVNTDSYKEALENIVDVDSLVRYFAVNTYLVNLDSYQSEKMQNYALYVKDHGKATVIPWDYNYSFETYGIGSASDMVNFDIYNPVMNTTLGERPLLNLILQNDEYLALYEQYLNDCCIIASEGGITSDGQSYETSFFASQLDAFQTILNEQDGNSYSDDPTAFYTLKRYNTATESFKQLIADRREAVTRQLAGDSATVETTVNLQTLGDTTGGLQGGMVDKIK